jgi:hypothetical protein
MVDAAGLLRRPIATDNAAMDAEPKRKRRWFQFSLRTLLILTLIVALSCRWLGKRIERNRDERAAVQAIVKLGGNLFYSREGANEWEAFARIEPAAGSGWYQDFFGESEDNKPVAVVFGASYGNASYGIRNPRMKIDGRGLINLNALTSLEMVDLRVTEIGDADLESFKSMTWLKRIDLRQTGVTRAAVDELQKALPGCQIVRD